jgi:uncharacterized membrane protein
VDKELVIVVPTDAAAYAVVNALKGLDSDGSIELYSSTVIAKSKDGTLTTKAKETRELLAPVGTALGLSTGALIGLLAAAGPVGAAIGAAAGGAVGFGGDLAYSGFVGDFVHDVVARLQPGYYAVCASVWEDWSAPVDLAVAPFGAVVLRQPTDDIVVAQIRADVRALEEELTHLDAEIARAESDAKAKLETRRNELLAKQAAQRERLQKRANALQQSWEARIASIKRKVSDAKADAKARHEQHKEKLSRFAAQQKEAFQELFA